MYNQNNVSFLGNHVPRRNDCYAVVLAGGDGSRLRSLTRTIVGDERPKQFCPILNSSTLLDETRRRIALSISTANTLFSLTEKHRNYFEHPLWNVSDQSMVVQPENKGTAPAILYSLMRLAKSSPDATVAFFPSDHYFSDDDAFMDHVDSGFLSAKLNPDAVVLLGIEADKPETSYGWIEPANSLFGDQLGSVSRVARFWEKPTAGVAAELMKKRCLWNSFVMIGSVRAFLEMFQEHLPSMFRMFAAVERVFGRPEEAAAVRAIYSWIEETNFSTDVLEKAVERLLVLRVGEVGWSDWGEPQRVVGTLTNLGISMEWMHALAA
jgi:mannose-1-phosphate guanylyltransferase